MGLPASSTMAVESVSVYVSSSKTCAFVASAIAATIRVLDSASRLKALNDGIAERMSGVPVPPRRSDAGKPFTAAWAVGPPTVISTPPRRTHSVSALTWSGLRDIVSKFSITMASRLVIANGCGSRESTPSGTTRS